MLDLIERPHSLSLELPDNISFEDWRDIGVKLSTASRKISWFIGDWLITGNLKYGDQAKLAAEAIFGLGYSSLANIKTVCRKFEPYNRLENVCFTHYQVAAVLPIEEALAVVNDAARDGWSVKQVRDQVTRIRINRGDFTPLPNDDPLQADISALQGAWNRSSVEAREYCLALFNESSLGVIDA